MKHLLAVVVYAALAGCASTAQVADTKPAPHYRTWQEKLNAENPARQRTTDLVLRDMMRPAQMPMIDPTQLRR